MKLTVAAKLDTTQEVIALGLFEDEKETKINKELDQELLIAFKQKMFTGKSSETYSTKINGQFFVVVGLGKKEEITLEKVRKALGKAVNYAKKQQRMTLATNLSVLVAEKIKPELLGRASAEALFLADYDFMKYLSQEKQVKRKPLTVVSLQWSQSLKEFEEGLKIGKLIGETTNIVRDLVHEPANITSSVYMEKVVYEMMKPYSSVAVRVLNEPELKKLGMGALLGVNAGSVNPPKLIVLEYKGGGNGKWQAILGKGITFDSGGYNLKPTKYIEDMKTDMAGAAAVLGTIKICAELGLKKNIVGVMAMCENMVSSKAQRPGDIVRAYNGKTIEIGNTDAEGRLVLADALAYTEDKYKPEVMIDVATLTGACIVALGYYASGVMGTDDELLEKLKKAGMNSGDKVWPLPFFEEYQNWMDGKITDLNNTSLKGKGYEAGSITGGVFLGKFVDKAKWAHIDIAGPAYTYVDNDYMQQGATGAGVRVLTYYFLEN